MKMHIHLLKVLGLPKKYVTQEKAESFSVLRNLFWDTILHTAAVTKCIISISITYIFTKIYTYILFSYVSGIITLVTEAALSEKYMNIFRTIEKHYLILIILI